MNKETLSKKYPWLFKKKVFMIINGKKEYSFKQFDPIIEDHESHWRVYREKDSSPLILSKQYEL